MLVKFKTLQAGIFDESGAQDKKMFPREWHGNISF